MAEKGVFLPLTAVKKGGKRENVWERRAGAEAFERRRRYAGGLRPGERQREGRKRKRMGKARGRGDRGRGSVRPRRGAMPRGVGGLFARFAFMAGTDHVAGRGRVGF